MIQLYKFNNNNYEKNGNFVIHPISANLHIVLNGEWSLTICCPIGETNPLNEKAEDYMVIGAVFSIDYVKEKNQLYVIDNVTKDEDTITCICYPIFMMDSKNAVILEARHPTNCNGQDALDSMLLGNENGLSGESDIETINTAYYEKKNFMEALNGNDDNAFLKRWGGEVYYLNKKIIVNKVIGKDRGLRVESSFNMQGINIKIDSSNLVTCIYPQGYNGRVAPPVYSDRKNDYRTLFKKYIEYSEYALASDLSESSDNEEYIIFETEDELFQALQERAKQDFAKGADLPTFSYTVDMIDLRNTDEYKDFKDLLYVWIGDFVHVKNKKLNINTVQEVVELEFDCIYKEITSLTLGAVQANYFDTLGGGK